MGKEKFVRSKPHVNVPEEADPSLAAARPTSAGEPIPTESVSFNFSKIEFESKDEGAPLADLRAPSLPADDPPVRGTDTITFTGLESSHDKPMDQLALSRDGADAGNTHELESISLTYQRIDLESAPADGPSTMVALEPQDDGSPDALTTDTEVQGILIGQLVPAIQKLGDPDTDPDDLEDPDLDL